VDKLFVYQKGPRESAARLIGSVPKRHQHVASCVPEIGKVGDF
jgi:hypothetical protein